jgi:predicted negative regulator of RcsB-dependent stress response
MSADLKESSAPLGEISQGPNAFEEFLDRNQKGIAVLAILLALGGIGAVIYRGVEASRQQTAGEALVRAEDLASLQAVVDQNKDTHAAGSALILLANSQWTAGKKDEAVGTLQSFIASSPTHPAIPTAKASLGSKLMIQGKSGDATKIFEELSTDPAARFIAPFALISLGDIARAAGDPDKAEPFYAKVKTDFPESSFADTAGKRIATLKAKAPLEIDPPPAPVTPPVSANPMDALKASLPPGVTITPSPAQPETPAPSPEPETPPAPKP